MLTMNNFGKEEYRFQQNFDIIFTKKRYPLFFETGIQKTFYNGTTELRGATLEEVITDKPYIVYPLAGEKIEPKSLRDYLFTATCIDGVVLIYKLCLDMKWTRNRTISASFVETARYYFDNRYLYKKSHVSKKERLLLSYSVHVNKSISNCDGIKEYLKNANTCTVFSSGARKEVLSTNNNNIHMSWIPNFKNGESQEFCEVLSDAFIPMAYSITGNDFQLIEDFDQLLRYYEHCGKKDDIIKKSGKNQDTVDEYTQICKTLPKIKDIVEETSEDGVLQEAIIQRVPTEEPACVVRMFLRKKTAIFECGRIYINKKTVLFCKKNRAGEYVAQPLPTKVEHWSYSIANIPAEITEGTKAQYFTSVVEKAEKNEKLLHMWMFLKYPMLESIAKIGGQDAVSEVIRYMIKFDVQIKTALSNVLDIEEITANKLFDAMGINSKQFDVVKEYFIDYHSLDFYSNDCNKSDLRNKAFGIIPYIKKMLPDCKSVDIETFKKYAEFAHCAMIGTAIFYGNEIASKRIRILDAIEAARNAFGSDYNVPKLFPVLEKMFLTKEHYKISENISNLYDGFTFCAAILNNKKVDIDKKHIAPNFKTVDDILTWHDNVTIVMGSMGCNKEDYKFEIRYENVWKDYEWGENRKEFPYVVVAPKKSLDVATEGTVLCHCVKGYIPRLAEGSTNVVFIREKKNPNEPFFTVEIDNNKVIQQVHGSHNCNMDTVKGLTEFVQAWSRAKHLKIGNVKQMRG